MADSDQEKLDKAESGRQALPAYDGKDGAMRAHVAWHDIKVDPSAGAAIHRMVYPDRSENRPAVTLRSELVRGERGLRDLG
jgi:hypothetical protein